MSSALFRQEALAAKQDLHGAALGIRPVSAPRLTAFFAALALAVLLLLIFGSYTKKERVVGVVQAQQGVALILPPANQSGSIIQRVLVVEGQQVKAGDVVLALSQERYSDAGSADALLEQNLQAQHRRLESQAQGQSQIGAATRSALQERIRHARHDQETLDEEIRLQGQQIATSTRMVEQLKPLLADRVISELQYEQQHAQLLDQQARLQALKRQRTAAVTEATQAGEELRRLAGQTQVEQAGLDRDLLSLQQEQVQRRAQRVTLIKAPMDGVISGLTATPGQALGVNAVLASVVPQRAALEVVLYVPSTAVGFIKPGQGVRISYDAFPYQRFGQYRGTVRSVSQSDVPMASAGGEGNKDRRAVFLVKVQLDKDSVAAYGTETRLRPGLTLSADIEIDRRRLIRWMLDPLFAFTGQL